MVDGAARFGPYRASRPLGRGADLHVDATSRNGIGMFGRGDAGFLAGTKLFTGLDAEALDAAAAAAVKRAFQAGRALFRQGDMPDHLFLVTEGRVRISQINGEGDSFTVRVMGPGDVPGCVAAFRRTPFPATATAVLDTGILAWPLARFGELMERHPRIAANALDLVGGRTEEMLRLLREIATEPVERRIARALLRLSRQAGRPGGDGVEIGFPLSRQDIAEMTGTTLHTVSRTLSEWERQGLVAGGRQRVVIRDPGRLAQIGAGHGRPRSPERG